MIRVVKATIMLKGRQNAELTYPCQVYCGCSRLNSQCNLDLQSV